MKLSKFLKDWLVKNWKVKADADDETFKKAAGEAIVAGVEKGGLSAEMLQKLQSDQPLEEKGGNSNSDNDTEVSGFLKSLNDGIATSIATALKGLGLGQTQTQTQNTEGETKSTQTTTKSKHVPSALESIVVKMGLASTDEDDEEHGVKTMNIRVKNAVERYDGTKSAMVYTTTQKGSPHPLAGRPVVDFSSDLGGKQLYNPSERDKAIAGAYAKYSIQVDRLKSRRMALLSLPDHDRDILMYALENEKWGGSSDGSNIGDINGKLTVSQQKALIDDSTSGGTEAAPIVFDDMVITTPLLYGQLFPWVTIVPLERGRRVEGVATGQVTGGWGGVDDTAIDLFVTTSYITAFDTTIFRWEGAILLGLDFLSDTPIDFASHVSKQYGDKLLEDLDDAIASGNGTSEPEGISVKAGTTSVAWGGATSIGNYESLRFAVNLAEHQGQMNTAVFCGSETSYMRARAIPVGASDARRLGGNNITLGGVSGYDNYSWMDRPFKINESMGNSTIFYAILSKYRMYRRRGLTMRQSTEGQTLIRNNELLISCTCRYGGQLTRGACASKTTTAPA